MVKIVPGEETPPVVYNGHFYQAFCAAGLVIGLREDMIKRDPSNRDEIDRAERQVAIKILCGIGMSMDMAAELVNLMIGRAQVTICCKTRPYEQQELPKGVKLGEHIGYDFKLIVPPNS